MSSTNFINNQTIIDASWLNDVNSAVYNGTFQASILTPNNLVCNGSVSGTGFTNLVSGVFASPGPIGNGTPSTGAFTTLNATTSLTLNSVAVTTISGTQTLTNKTLTSPVITTPTISQINSASTTAPTIFANSSGTQIGTLCRAWVSFNGASGASPVIRASFNVSSVSRTGTGTYTVTLTNAMTDVNYAPIATGTISTGGGARWVGSYPSSTSSILVESDDYTGSPTDLVLGYLAVFR
jgi:hypothetical protein